MGVSVSLLEKIIDTVIMVGLACVGSSVAGYWCADNLNLGWGLWLTLHVESVILGYMAIPVFKCIWGIK